MLYAILAVTGRFIPELVSQHAGPEATGDFYAAKAEIAVMAHVLDDPNPVVVQSLLLISLHHWGACNGSRAWMLAGMLQSRFETVSLLTTVQGLLSGWRKR
jgi:hypothetical protein